MVKYTIAESKREVAGWSELFRNRKTDIQVGISLSRYLKALSRGIYCDHMFTTEDVEEVFQGTAYAAAKIQDGIKGHPTAQPSRAPLDTFHRIKIGGLPGDG